MTNARIVPRPRVLEQLREATAYGVLNFCFAVEADTKRDSVVRGGHRSFAPDGPVGGTLRRSWHAVVYMDGRRVAGRTADENGEPVPDYVPEHGITGFVGSNCGYGGYVELGTTKMPARPMLGSAFMKNRSQASALIVAGAQRHIARAA